MQKYEIRGITRNFLAKNFANQKEIITFVGKYAIYTYIQIHITNL